MGGGMFRVLTIISLIQVGLTGCSGTDEKRSVARLVELACDLDSSTLGQSKVVIVEKKGQRIRKEDVEFCSYPLSPSACVLIPASARDDLVIRSGTHGLRIPAATLPPGFNKKPLALKRIQTGFDPWSYCGEALHNGEMFLKLAESALALEKEPLHFLDRFGKHHPLNPNSQACVRVPAGPGRLMGGSRILAGIQEVKPIHFIPSWFKPADQDRDDFFSFCLKKGRQDPVIDALASATGQTGCREIAAKLSGLPDSQELFVNRGISDLRPLKGLNFRRLDLSGNRISSLEGLQDMEPLESLILSHNPLLFVDGLPPGIRHLDLSYTLCGFLGKGVLQGIRSLNISGTEIQGFTGLRDTTSLEELSMNDLLLLEGCSFLHEPGLLRFLSASGTPCAARALARGGSRQLTELLLDHTQLEDITWIARYPNLKGLSLGHNNIREISALKSLKELVILYLHSNPLSSFESISGLSSLLSLTIHNTGCRDISFVEGLDLITFAAEYNHITDLEPLAKHLHLESLLLDYNPVRYCPAAGGAQVLRSFCNGLGLKPFPKAKAD